MNSDDSADSSLTNTGDNEDVGIHEDDTVMMQRKNKRKVELMESASDSHGSPSNGKSKQTLDKSVEVDICEHPGQNLGMCIKCGKKLDSHSGASIDRIQKAHDETSRLRDKHLKSLLKDEKLCLVLDLDHTLVNSIDFKKLSADEKYLESQTADNMHDQYKDSLYRVGSMNMFTKLRPFVRTFLEEASNLFEMYIYTMAQRVYALEMITLLDPQNLYFKSRVIAQDDSTKKDQKSLDMVHAQENAVLILDHTKSVWSNHLENLILTESYHFFASSLKESGISDDISFAELHDDESEETEYLASILKVLKQVHAMFFDQNCTEDLLNRDVRQILKEVKRDVLKGCIIVFSSEVLPPDVAPENEPFSETIEEFGASCSNKVDPTVTHVISKDDGTEESRWAVKEKKFLVTPRWLVNSYYAWQRQPEKNYAVFSQEVKKDQ